MRKSIQQKSNKIFSLVNYLPFSFSYQIPFIYYFIDRILEQEKRSIPLKFLPPNVRLGQKRSSVYAYFRQMLS